MDTIIYATASRKGSTEYNNSRKYSLLSTDSYSDERRDLISLTISQKEPNFGVLFDIDGVLMRGPVPITGAVEAINKLKNLDGKLKIPIAFVTNACADPQPKLNLLKKTFDIELELDQIIFAPSPLSVYVQWHNHCVLVLGQGDVVKIAKNLGFKYIFTMDQVAKAYPLLDMVDHLNRKNLSSGHKDDPNFPRIEAIIMLGEPNRWEMHLQLLIDLLVTNGKPDHKPEFFSEEHLPIIACNLDLIFMAEAAMPRFGHGAFLVCLESLYERITGHTLHYSALIGKPSEITYRFSEHVLARASKRLGYTRPLRKLYFFGDNPEVDILGANLYNMYLRRYRRLSGGRQVPFSDRGTMDKKAAVCNSRIIPPEAAVLPQTARGIESILVQTGVYKAKNDEKKPKRVNYCHRDFLGATDLVLPSFETTNVLEGINLMLEEENFDATLT